jgi:2-C-methyl-D-erythritol 4-phosphate cytidylyltransferase
MKTPSITGKISPDDGTAPAVADLDKIPCSSGELADNKEDSGIFALIVAGGSGQRMGSGIPKQFIELAGRPVLMHTLENFFRFDSAMEIILVLSENMFGLWKDLCRKHQFLVPHKMVAGGRERFYSVKNGLEALSGDGIVFIHDGVRPLVSHDTLNRCLSLAMENGNALPVIPVLESVRKEVDGTSQPVDRNILRLVQTPQTFRLSLIKKAYSQPFDKQFTDDASVLEKSGHAIYLTEGNRENIKITWPEDLIMAELLLRQKPADR